MKFGRIAIDEAEGALLAHSVAAGPLRLRKGHRISRSNVEALREAGISQVIAVRPEADDVGEDEAAVRIARALRTRNIELRPPATGRANLHAAHAGVFTVRRDLVDAVNAVDPAITLATLAPFATVTAGQMVATVKIIPFAVSNQSLAAVERLCVEQIFSAAPFRPHRIALLQTTLPGVKASVLDKTKRVTEARLSRSGSAIVRETRVRHEVGATTAALAAGARDADLVILFGASAVCDADDVIPAAIRAAGGEVLRVGMPVDPGNLLVLGRMGATPVIGAPGCARSPKENGFDWVLDRICAGLDVTSAEIASTGVGGLLTEIGTRPQPRETFERPRPPTVHIVVLAAGRSSRMGGANKLLAAFDGEPLVRLVASRALSSRARGTTVVTGHQAERVRAALADMAIAVVDNPDYTSGLAGSLKCGIASVPGDADGVLVMLGDMPGVATADLDRMIEAFRASGGHVTVRATAEGKRGNPVILPRSLFSEVARLEGDTGARHLVEGGPVIDIELGGAAALDVDTPEAMASAGGVLQA